MCEGMQNGRRSRLGPSWDNMSRADGLAWALQRWAMSRADGIVRADVVVLWSDRRSRKGPCVGGMQTAECHVWAPHDMDLK